MKKLEELIEEGICDARDLVEYDGMPVRWSGTRDLIRGFERIRSKAVELFKKRENECNRLASRILELKEQLTEAESAVELAQVVTNQMAARGKCQLRKRRYHQRFGRC